MIDDQNTGFVDLDWHGKPIRLECEWVGLPRTKAPVVVFLHEGLGSVSAWRDFPKTFCMEHGLTGFVFSRYGYGNSTPRPHHERWTPDYPMKQAREVLPLLFKTIGIERPWLFGHSDGANIALFHAAHHSVAGVVVEAPHLFLDEVSIAGVTKAREAFERGNLRERLARHHADPVSAFYGWNDTWFAPENRHWNVETEIDSISCPVLAIQGEEDNYGTLEQIYVIARRLPQTRLLALPKCGHSPHREQPEIISREAGQFILGKTI
jgi:pimeloyl-ACP methyl ester carboxylesterase